MPLNEKLKKDLVARSNILINAKPETESEERKDEFVIISDREAKEIIHRSLKRKLHVAFEDLIDTNCLVDASMTIQGLNKLHEALGCFEAALLYPEETPSVEKK